MLPPFSNIEKRQIWNIGYKTIQELETDLGILASGRKECYACLFGRDSLITSLFLLKAFEATGDVYLLRLVRTVLLGLAALQGKTENIESGEEVGRCIHEFRTKGHEHLTKASVRPWYVYPDGVMRIYDTADATPLFLIAVHRYSQVCAKIGEPSEILDMLSFHITNALQWILNRCNANREGFVDFRVHPNRKHGGLTTQSWMDSHDSVFHENGDDAPHPIAPVEVQAYSYLALRYFARYFAVRQSAFSRELQTRASLLKEAFNTHFVLTMGKHTTFAFALDGNGRAMTSLRSNIGHILWAADTDEGVPTCILDHAFIPQVKEQLMSPELFDPQAGIRTLTRRSRCYGPHTYHNGSIWPHDNSICIEGLENFGFEEQAIRVRKALLRAWLHFGSAIELYSADAGQLSITRLENGQESCRSQAWSAAAMLKESSCVAC